MSEERVITGSIGDISPVAAQAIAAAEKRGRIAGLKEAKKIIEDGVPDPSPGSVRCPHGTYYYEPCDNCLIEAIDSRIQSLEGER